MDHRDLFTDTKSATPQADMPAAMEAIRKRWNLRIPSKRFRLWTPRRRADAIGTLRAWPLDQILAAVDVYAVAPWQKKHHVWLPIDKWITLEHATTWAETALQIAEDRGSTQVSADAQLQAAVEDAAEALRLKSADEETLALFHAKPEPDRVRILTQASAELESLHGRPFKPLLKIHIVKTHVLAIMRRTT